MLHSGGEVARVQLHSLQSKESAIETSCLCGKMAVVSCSLEHLHAAGYAGKSRLASHMHTSLVLHSCTVAEAVSDVQCV